MSLPLGGPKQRMYTNALPPVSHPPAPPAGSGPFPSPGCAPAASPRVLKVAVRRFVRVGAARCADQGRPPQLGAATLRLPGRRPAPMRPGPGLGQDMGAGCSRRRRDPRRPRIRQPDKPAVYEVRFPQVSAINWWACTLRRESPDGVSGITGYRVVRTHRGQPDTYRGTCSY